MYKTFRLWRDAEKFCNENPSAKICSWLPKICVFTPKEIVREKRE
jgi:hypothetical protein